MSKQRQTRGKKISRSATEIHVYPSHEGWVIARKAKEAASSTKHKAVAKARKGETVIAVYHRKRDAELAARRDLMASGGGDAVIHRLNGRIEERDSVRPAKHVEERASDG